MSSSMSSGSSGSSDSSDSERSDDEDKKHRKPSEANALLAKDNEKRGKKKKTSQRMSAIAFVSSRFGTKRSNRTNRHGATDKERVVVEHKRGGGGGGRGGGAGGGAGRGRVP